MTGQTTTTRLAPEVRKAQILNAARELLARVGVSDFSLEAVACNAGVAASLPRHYFGSSTKLLVSVVLDVLQDVETALFNRDMNVSLAPRFIAYIEVLRENPWIHSIWLRASEIDPYLATIVRKTRQRMAEFSFMCSWDEMSRRDQILARGWIGYAEAAIMDWIDSDMQDESLLLEALLDGAKRLGVKGVG